MSEVREPKDVTAAREKITKKGYPFYENVESYLPLLQPVLTKAGKVAKDNPRSPYRRETGGKHNAHSVEYRRLERSMICNGAYGSAIVPRNEL